MDREEDHSSPRFLTHRVVPGYDQVRGPWDRLRTTILVFIPGHITPSPITHHAITLPTPQIDCISLFHGFGVVVQVFLDEGDHHRRRRRRRRREKKREDDDDTIDDSRENA